MILKLKILIILSLLFQQCSDKEMMKPGELLGRWEGKTQEKTMAFLTIDEDRLLVEYVDHSQKSHRNKFKFYTINGATEIEIEGIEERMIVNFNTDGVLRFRMKPEDSDKIHIPLIASLDFTKID